MEEVEFSPWLFEGRLRQGKNVLPDGLNWLCYFAGSSKSHLENSISFIFLISPHQVSRQEKHCQILQTLFWVLQYSRNSQCRQSSGSQSHKIVMSFISYPMKLITYLFLFFISFSVHNLAYGLDWSSNQWWKYLSCHYRCAIPKNISGMNNFVLYFHKIIK